MKNIRIVIKVPSRLKVGSTVRLVSRGYTFWKVIADVSQTQIGARSPTLMYRLRPAAFNERGRVVSVRGAVLVPVLRG